MWKAYYKSTQVIRGFIKGRALGKLTCCERDFAINLPGCFHLLFLLSIMRKTKNAQLKNPTDLLHKNLMKPLICYTYYFYVNQSYNLLVTIGCDTEHVRGLKNVLKRYDNYSLWRYFLWCERLNAWLAQHTLQELCTTFNCWFSPSCWSSKVKIITIQ